MWLFFLPIAAAETLDSLLARGEVTLTETDGSGRLKQATCYAQIAAPIESVWAVLADFERYPSWIGQVRSVGIVSRTEDTVVADWTLSVVGPDISFRTSSVLDPASHTIRARQVSGALTGSTWAWLLSVSGTGTLVRRVVHTNVVQTNWLLKQVDDSDHTLDYGINSASGVVELKALKRHFAGG